MQYVGRQHGGQVLGGHLVAGVARVVRVRGQLRQEAQQRVERVAVRRWQQLDNEPQRFPLQLSVAHS